MKKCKQSLYKIFQQVEIEEKPVLHVVIVEHLAMQGSIDFDHLNIGEFINLFFPSVRFLCPVRFSDVFRG